MGVLHSTRHEHGGATRSSSTSVQGIRATSAIENIAIPQESSAILCADIPLTFPGIVMVCAAAVCAIVDRASVLSHEALGVVAADARLAIEDCRSVQVRLAGRHCVARTSTARSTRRS